MLFYPHTVWRYEMTTRYSIKDFEAQFPTEESCLEFLYQARWPKGVSCKKCNKATKHYRVKSRKSYECEFCGNHVHPTAGTIFHKSRTPLKSWFHAIFLMAITRTGISAKHLERTLGVTYKTAWRMFTEIRKLMDEDLDPFTGKVEVDETYIGGKSHGKAGRPGPDSPKAPVAGIVERQGSVVAKMVPNTTGKTLMGFIAETTDSPISVYTDEYASYSTLSRTGYTHETIRHSAQVYVRGDVHTNTIEGFWSTMKRGIDGAHHSVSRKYLQSYLNEYAFRYNRRNDSTPMFTLLVNQISEQASGSAA